MRYLRDGRRLLEVRQELRRLVDQRAIVLAGRRGEAVHDLLPGRVGRVALARKARQQHGVDQLLDVPLGDGVVAVAVGDHLALLGDADAPVDGAVRLGQDDAVGRPAAAPDGPAPAVEERDADARAQRQLRQLDLRPVQRPRRLQETRLLVAVGVAEHDLLRIPAQRELPAVGRHIEELAQDARRRPQRVERLEQRHDVEPALPRTRVVQPRLPSQEQHLEQVRRLRRHADDVRPNRLRALPLEDRRDGAERLHHFDSRRAVFQARWDQRPGAFEFLRQQRQAFFG